MDPHLGKDLGDHRSAQYLEPCLGLLHRKPKHSNGEKGEDSAEDSADERIAPFDHRGTFCSYQHVDATHQVEQRRHLMRGQVEVGVEEEHEFSRGRPGSSKERLALSLIDLMPDDSCIGQIGYGPARFLKRAVTAAVIDDHDLHRPNRAQRRGDLGDVGSDHFSQIEGRQDDGKVWPARISHRPLILSRGPVASR